MNRFLVPCLSSVLILSARPAPAQEPLTLDAALARARTDSPTVVAARLRVDEARARLRGASRLRDNPQLEAAAGRREHGGGWDAEVGLSQTFELGGRRGARVAVAEAAVARDVALAEDTLRGALRDVAEAYVAAASARERLQAAEVAAGYAEEILRIARRRHEQGDVAALDVNVAQSGASRARADVHAAAATGAAALGTLRSLLGLDPDAPLALGPATTDRDVPEVSDLLALAQQRADVQATEADLREAEAEVRLGKSLAWPELTPGIRWERDDGTNILWGGLTVTLPVLNRGHEAREAAEARVQRARWERDALRLRIRNEVQSGWTAYSLRRKAADELRAQTAALDDNDALARRSYEVGQIGLGELLLVRRETAEARGALVDRLAEAAVARIELEARAGVLR